MQDGKGPVTTAQFTKTELNEYIRELGRGEAPALKAAEAIGKALEAEVAKEARKPRGIADDIKNIGRHSRMEKINRLLFDVDSIRMDIQINMGVEKTSLDLRSLAQTAESTFFAKQGSDRSVMEQLQEHLREIFEIKK